MNEQQKQVLILIALVVGQMSLAGATAIMADAKWGNLFQPMPVLLMVGAGATAVVGWATKGKAEFSNGKTTITKEGKGV